VGPQTETQRDFSVFLLSCQHVRRPVCFPPALLFVYDPFSSSCISCSRRNALMEFMFDFMRLVSVSSQSLHMSSRAAGWCRQVVAWCKCKQVTKQGALSTKKLARTVAQD
jgi:hypothetical protein